MILDAINRYHDLLQDPAIAEAADAHLRQRLKEEGLYFGKRPLCVVLRPHFYFEVDWRIMQQGLEALLSAFWRAHNVCVVDAKARAQLHLEDYEERLFGMDTGGPAPWSSSRLDTFYVVEDHSLKVVEYNAETPAGLGYSDVLDQVFQELEPFKRFQDHYKIRSLPTQPHLEAALLKAYHDWGGREQPQIAILDWSDVPTISEHEIQCEYLLRRGIPTVLADPRVLEYRGGHLWKGDFRIDVIYKRALYSELAQRLGFESDLLRAIQERSVFITNSPSCKLLFKKASLAFLSDEQNTHVFDDEQQQAIRDYIPWTRVVTDRMTFYDGREIDLVPFIAENRERLVLKPNDDFGGRGVVLGWECDDTGWQEALKNARNSPHVVQEKAPTVQRDFPMWLDGQLDVSPRYVDADPYIFGGDRVGGCLTRLSPAALLNVTAGGGSVVPTFVIANKR